MQQWENVMNGHAHELSLEELASGERERCAWCKAPFIHTEGKWQRWKGQDNRFYCSPEHGSAPYLTARLTPTKWWS